MSRRILLVNGPNLNLLGMREPEIYGRDTLADVVRLVTDTASRHGFDVRAMQSNHEGELVDAVQAAREDCQAILINPAAYTHTSIALRDALTAVQMPVAEVHLSNVHGREEFRHHSYISPIANFVIAGCGVQGYEFAVERLVRLIH